MAVTFGMFFYGKSKRICPGCKAQLDRYSHIQWECTGLMSKVDEAEIVDVIGLRQNYFKQISDR